MMEGKSQCHLKLSMTTNKLYSIELRGYSSRLSTCTKTWMLKTTRGVIAATTLAIAVALRLNMVIIKQAFAPAGAKFWIRFVQWCRRGLDNLLPTVTDFVF